MKVKIIRSTVINGERIIVDPKKPKEMDISDKDARYLIATKKAVKATGKGGK